LKFDPKSDNDLRNIYNFLDSAYLCGLIACRPRPRATADCGRFWFLATCQKYLLDMKKGHGSLYSLIRAWRMGQHVLVSRSSGIFTTVIMREMTVMKEFFYEW